MSPFIAVRLGVSAGYSLRCYFPGFANPTNGYGSSLSVSFYISNTHHFKSQPLPYFHYSAYQSRTNTIGLTSQPTSAGMWSVNENSQFWTQNGKVDQSGSYYLNVLNYGSYTNPMLYFSSYYPKPNQNACANSNFI